MSVLQAIFILILLIIISAFVSAAEISLAGARKLKLQSLANDGDSRAEKVLKLQEHPGRFITVVQIGLNMVAVFGGMIGESTLSPYFKELLTHYTSPEWLEPAASMASFILVTTSFILLADLMPKRLAITNPETVALKVVNLMSLCIFILKPLVWIFDSLASLIFRLFGVSTVRQENMTSEDIVAMMDAGAEAGVLKQQEHYLIENIFEMQERTVTSTMTTRENIVFLDRSFDRQAVVDTLAKNSHSKLLICDNGLDKILGYVESHTLLTLYLQTGKDVSLTDNRLLRKALFIPDTLSLFEVLELFKSSGEDFAVIINEYALVVGIVTLNDVMSIVMGELVSEEDQIVQRDEHSWLIDGATPLEDVMRALDINEFPDAENYETISGFMMYMLRKIPKKTDFVLYDKYKFEIIDTENYKIDQLLVSIRKDLDIN